MQILRGVGVSFKGADLTDMLMDTVRQCDLRIKTYCYLSERTGHEYLCNSQKITHSAPQATLRKYTVTIQTQGTGIRLLRPDNIC